MCKIPMSGLVETSSLQAEDWAKDQYFYDGQNGSIRALKDTGRGHGGMIWRSVLAEQGAPARFEPRQSAAQFYVGTEEQYDHAISIGEKGPFKKSEGAKSFR